MPPDPPMPWPDAAETAPPPPAARVTLEPVIEEAVPFPPPPAT